jgi:hypothetical protein
VLLIKALNAAADSRTSSGCSVRPLSEKAPRRGHKTDTSETDTRDASRRIRTAGNGLISRQNRVASDRACTRVTPGNLHGKEGVDGSSPSEGLHKAPAK